MAVVQELGIHSRRAVLAGALGGLGALVVRSLGGTPPVDAASAVQLGASNTETVATAIRNSSPRVGSIGVVGRAASAGGMGFQGVAEGRNGFGLRGVANVGSNAAGVFGSSNTGIGVRAAGITGLLATGAGPNGTGVKASAPKGMGVQATGGTTGVFGDATGDGGTGVRGDSNTGTTASGVVGNSTEGAGVRGNGTNNYGVYGTGGYCGTRGQGGTYGSISSGTSVGAYGSGSDYGLYGAGGTYGAYAGGSTYGVYGSGPTGVLGSGSTYGVVGTTSNINTDAVRGSGGQYAVHGLSARTAGTRGDSGYVGAWGQANLYGVYGLATDGSATSYGVFGQASNNASYGVWCQGNMQVTGTLYKSAGSFRIDHPLDPDRRWLSHSFVESPDMMNVYNGNAVLDGKGTATIRLPRYFDALNRDFRYQLTALGGPAPSLHVAREIANNAFTIAGGVPGLKVSWQVTGIRHDDYAMAHPIVVEMTKTEAQLGTRQFVPRGSKARLMKVGPAQPKGRPASTPTDVPRIVEPRAA